MRVCSAKFSLKGQGSCLRAACCPRLLGAFLTCLYPSALSSEPKVECHSVAPSAKISVSYFLQKHCKHLPLDLCHGFVWYHQGGIALLVWEMHFLAESPHVGACLLKWKRILVTAVTVSEHWICHCTKLWLLFMVLMWLFLVGHYFSSLFLCYNFLP